MNYNEKQLIGEKKKNLSCSFYLYRFHKYMSYGFPIINFCNPGLHYETPCIHSNLFFITFYCFVKLLAMKIWKLLYFACIIHTFVILYDYIPKDLWNVKNEYIN